MKNFTQDSLEKLKKLELRLGDFGTIISCSDLNYPVGVAEITVTPTAFRREYNLFDKGFVNTRTQRVSKEEYENSTFIAYIFGTTNSLKTCKDSDLVPDLVYAPSKEGEAFPMIYFISTQDIVDYKTRNSMPI